MVKNGLWPKEVRVGCATRLADVRFGSGSAVSELNLDQTWRSSPGRTANLDLDLVSGPVQVRTRFE